MNLNVIYCIENEIRIYRNNRTGEELIDKGWSSFSEFQAWEIAKATGDTFHVTVINAFTGEVLRERELAA